MFALKVARLVTTSVALRVRVEATLMVELSVTPLVTVNVEDNVPAPDTAKVLERRKAVEMIVSPLTMEIPLTAVPKLETETLCATMSALTSSVETLTVDTVGMRVPYLTRQF